MKLQDPVLKAKLHGLHVFLEEVQTELKLTRVAQLDKALGRGSILGPLGKLIEALKRATCG